MWEEDGLVGRGKQRATNADLRAGQIELGFAGNHDWVRRDDLVPDLAVSGTTCVESVIQTNFALLLCVKLMRYEARPEEREEKFIKTGERYALTSQSPIQLVANLVNREPFGG